MLSILFYSSICLTLCQYHIVLISVALHLSKISFEISKCETSNFFFFMIVLAIQHLRYFHTNFKITCPGSVKNAIGISVGIALNL